MIRAQITRIDEKKSYRGGIFKYIFFKDMATGKSYRTCVSSEFRNYSHWQDVRVGMILSKLFTKSGCLIDADSEFFVENSEEVLEKTL